ncbi:hypothetical protein BH11MYX1_BH11MYX1_56880 [soil metagenome]
MTTKKREIATVVRRSKLGALDEYSERAAYWKTQPIEARLREVEALRRMWIEVTGDPDEPIVRVVHKRRLGELAIQKP